MKKFIYTLVTILVSSLSFAQELPTIIPPSPEAVSLGKFTETPVSQYTGLPNISIPFYEIDLNGLSIPIGVSYHARGMKVEEISSRVGIGWVLNAGGMISRQIRGKADDGNHGYLRDNLYSDFFSNEVTRLDAWNRDILEELDFQPDLFSYNFLGYSGKFIIDQNSRVPLMQKFEDMIIEGNMTGSQMNSWLFTDQNGFKYFFGGTDANDTETVLNNYVYANELIDLDHTNSEHNNSWKLRSIVAPNGDEIVFKYEYEYSIYIRRNYDQTNTTIGSAPVSSYFTKVRSKQYQLKEIEFKQGKIVFEKETLEREDLNGSHALRNISLYNSFGQLIKKQNFSYTYFEAIDDDNQLPILKILEPQADKRLVLSSIEQENLNGNTNPPFRFIYNDQPTPNRYSNSQDNWGYYNGKDNGHFLTFFDYGTTSVSRQIDLDKSNAGMLNEIIYPNGGSVVFEFEHNKAVPPSYIDDLLFNINNPSQTRNEGLFKARLFWNGRKYVTNNITITNGIGSIHSDISIFNNQDCSSNTVTTNCPYRVYLRSIDEAYSATYFIGQNNYPMPPSGNYRIEVEPAGSLMNENPDDYENGFMISIRWEEQDFPDSQLLYGAGKRIRKITLKDNSNNIVKTTVYTYQNNEEMSSGRIFSLPFFHYIINSVDGVPIINTMAARSSAHMAAYQGNSLGYSQITELIGDETDNLGKTISTFTNFADGGAFYIYPYHLPTDNEWLRGKPLTIKNYKRNNDDFDLVKSTEYVYQYASTGTSHYHITDPLLPAEANHIYLNNRRQFNFPLMHFYDDGNPLTEGHNTYRIYNFNGGAFDLKYVVDKTFYNGGGLTTSRINHFYNYNNHYLPIKTQTLTSNNNLIESNTKYVTDIMVPNFIEQKLITQNRIAEPIQTETIVKDDVGNKLSKTKLYKHYKDWGNYIVLPEKVQTSKGDGAFEDRLIYHDYDDYGNPLEVSKADGTHIVYIWGYHQTQPIAKIENATYTQIENLINGLDLQTKSNADDDRTLGYTGNEGTLREALDNLRANLNGNQEEYPNAMVTTYTYDPLIGVTSITDPRGDVVYYHYDDLNRLKHVKDKDGNILSKNEYHYRNPN